MYTKTPRAVVLEEVEHLRSCGYRAPRIALELHMQPAAIARALYRVERPDLARDFQRLVARRARSCLDCGATITGSHSKRCRRCGFIERSRVIRESTAVAA